MANNIGLFFNTSKNTRSFAEVLAQVQEYLASKYSTLITDNPEEQRQQITAYIAKYLNDYSLGVEGMDHEALIDKLYTEMQVYPLGDIDMSGMAEVGDTSDILVYYAKVSAGQNVELTAVQKNLADVDLNGTVDITDACYNLAGYARAAAGQKAYNRDNEKQYYYAPVKIVIQDPDDPNYTGDLEPDTVYVPKTKA